MITFKNTRIEYGESITEKKIDGFIIIYETPSKGYLRSHLMQAFKDEEDNWHTINSLSVASITFRDTEFDGKNILNELHNIYVAELEKFNPNVEFEIKL